MKLSLTPPTEIVSLQVILSRGKTRFEPYSLPTSHAPRLVVIMTENIFVCTPPHHTVFTRIITKCRTDLKKLLSRTLTNEGIKQNAIISELSITAIIIYSRLSAVPQAADQVRCTIRLLFRPKGDDTCDPITQPNIIIGFDSQAPIFPLSEIVCSLYPSRQVILCSCPAEANRM